MRKNVLNGKALNGILIAVIISAAALLAWAQEGEFVAGDPGVVPHLDEWSVGGHANAAAEAFNHWNSDGVISTACAKCHSTPGHLDFLGADGTAEGVVDNPAPTGNTIQCIACHNEATMNRDTVVFPSGVTVTGLGDESRCMDCHQGRESGPSVAQAIADANVADDDTVSSALSFKNIHYLAAAATQYGGATLGGFQYDGKSYDHVYTHVEGLSTCIDCHDTHTLEVKVEQCGECHAGITTAEDLKHVRKQGSTLDYDGDGDVQEGIYHEIEGLQAILYGAIQAYANANGQPIVYEAHAYPYFFNDSNGNGQVDEGEASFPNAYRSWTARLLKAAYNYQVSLKDPGAFAHGGKYIIQLLYDSIEDLDAGLAAGLTRDDAGHFDGAAEAFRHWDEDGGVPSSCSKCHSENGLPFYLQEGVTVSQPVANGLACSTCHDSMPEYTRRTVDDVTFPSGMTATFGAGDDSNLCISCHQGRESKASVDAAIAGLDADTPDASLGFKNIHYLAAGATLFGHDVQGAYEYEGKTYAGRNEHRSSFDSCVECHTAHGGEVRIGTCGGCHDGVTDPKQIRKRFVDYDGDGDSVFEGLAGEVEGMADALYAAIQQAAQDLGTPIVYDAHAYPYFFKDTNGNGQVDPGEAIYPNRFSPWTPRLLKAAYNLQFALKDPGAYAHNGTYILQILYDSLEDLGAAAGKTRP